MLVNLNFTDEPQTVDLANSGIGGAAGKLYTSLKSPGGTDPTPPDHIELAGFGVYIGQFSRGVSEVN